MEQINEIWYLIVRCNGQKHFPIKGPCISTINITLSGYWLNTSSPKSNGKSVGAFKIRRFWKCQRFPRIQEAYIYIYIHTYIHNISETHPTRCCQETNRGTRTFWYLPPQSGSKFRLSLRPWSAGEKQDGPSMSHSFHRVKNSHLYLVRLVEITRNSSRSCCFSCCETWDITRDYARLLYNAVQPCSRGNPLPHHVHTRGIVSWDSWPKPYIHPSCIPSWLQPQNISEHCVLCLYWIPLVFQIFQWCTEIKQPATATLFQGLFIFVSLLHVKTIPDIFRLRALKLFGHPWPPVTTGRLPVRRWHAPGGGDTPCWAVPQLGF